MIKVNGFILGASALTKNKAGDPLNLCILHMLVPSDTGGYVSYDGFHGVANDAAGINALVKNNQGAPVPAEFTFGFQSYKNKTELRLISFLPVSKG